MSTLGNLSSLPSCVVFNNNTCTKIDDGGPTSSITGTQNTALGFDALPGLTSGNNNTAVGIGTLRSISNSGNNTAVGADAMGQVQCANNCTAVGYNAGATTSGSSNTFIGWNATANSTVANTRTIIGSNTNSTPSADSTILLGNASTTSLTCPLVQYNPLQGPSNLISLPVGALFCQPFSYSFNFKSRTDCTIVTRPLNIITYNNIITRKLEPSNTDIALSVDLNPIKLPSIAFFNILTCGSLMSLTATHPSLSIQVPALTFVMTFSVPVLDVSPNNVDGMFLIRDNAQLPMAYYTAGGVSRLNCTNLYTGSTNAPYAYTSAPATVKLLSQYSLTITTPPTTISFNASISDTYHLEYVCALEVKFYSSSTSTATLQLSSAKCSVVQTT